MREIEGALFRVVGNTSRYIYASPFPNTKVDNKSKGGSIIAKYAQINPFCYCTMVKQLSSSEK
jgi:hypothetical protein